MPARNARRAPTPPPLPYTAGVPTEPRWSEMRRLSVEASVPAALDRYYKPDRLNRDEGGRERIIEDREKTLAANGHDMLASRHESLTGHGLWMRFEEGGGVGIYSH